MDFKLKFETRVVHLRDMLDVVMDACGQVKSNGGFKKLLLVVLSISNFMNHGSFRGSASGFKLSTLSKIANMRTNKATETKTMLHYIARLSEGSMPELKQLGDLEVSDASKVERQMLSQELNMLRDDMRAVTAEIQSCEAESESDHAIAFVTAAKPFAEIATVEIEKMGTLFEKVDNELDLLAEYLCIEKKSFVPHKTFQSLSSFVSSFVRCASDNNRADEQKAKREMLEKKRNDKKNSGGPPRGRRRTRRQSLIAIQEADTDSGVKKNNLMDEIIGKMKEGNKAVFLKKHESPEDAMTKIKSAVQGNPDAEAIDTDDSSDDDWDVENL